MRIVQGLLAEMNMLAVYARSCQPDDDRLVILQTRGVGRYGQVVGRVYTCGAHYCEERGWYGHETREPLGRLHPDALWMESLYVDSEPELSPCGLLEPPEGGK